MVSILAQVEAAYAIELTPEQTLGFLEALRVSDLVEGAQPSRRPPSTSFAGKAGPDKAPLPVSAGREVRREQEHRRSRELYLRIRGLTFLGLREFCGTRLCAVMDRPDSSQRAPVPQP